MLQTRHDTNMIVQIYSAEGFTDLPVTNWGFDIVQFNVGSTWVFASKQQSDGELYIRGLNANSQWAGNWRRINIT